MSGKMNAKPLLLLSALALLLTACGPKVVISEVGKVPGAGPRAELARLINLQRREAGLVPLEADAKLAKAADAHAAAMAKNKCIDFDCGGRKTETRLGDAGYRAQSSRFYVSAGQPTPEDMIRQMMA